MKHKIPWKTLSWNISKTFLNQKTLNLSEKPWNTLKTSLKYPTSSMKYPWKFLKTPLKNPWNIRNSFLTPFKLSWNTMTIQMYLPTKKLLKKREAISSFRDLLITTENLNKMFCFDIQNVLFWYSKCFILIFKMFCFDISPKQNKIIFPVPGMMNSLYWNYHVCWRSC